MGELQNNVQRVSQPFNVESSMDCGDVRLFKINHNERFKMVVPYNINLGEIKYNALKGIDKLYDIAVQYGCKDVTERYIARIKDFEYDDKMIIEGIDGARFDSFKNILVKMYNDLSDPHINERVLDVYKDCLLNMGISVGYIVEEN